MTPALHLDIHGPVREGTISYRIALVNMPFATAGMPSIALTQLKASLHRDLGDTVACEVLYPNLDLAAALGVPFYELIATTTQANVVGLGDWFFSRVAFPEMPDQPEDYLLRHFSENRSQLAAFGEQLLEQRQAAGDFLLRVIDLYRLDRFSLVGFTSMFCQSVAGFALARLLKERNPEIVIVMGGANCEAPMGRVIARNAPWIDFVFSGPALISFPRLVRHLADGEQEACDEIPGVLSRRKLLLQGGPRGPEIGAELDIAVDLPLDYDDYLSAFDAKLPGAGYIIRKIPFETSRGCWWGERSHCTFCGLNGSTMSYRAMPPEAAVRQLHGLFERYAGQISEFQSVDNILPREYLTEVLPHLCTPPGVSLFYEIKADLKESEVEALARARVLQIQPGIEALSTTTLKLMRKGTTAFQNLKFLKRCQAHGIQAFWNLLIGFPGEPEDVYRKYCEDLPLLTHLQPPTGVYPVRFDRFSPYHSRAEEYRLQLVPSTFYGMIYPWAEDELVDFAYYFQDRNGEASYSENTARWLGKLRERIAHWRSRWQQPGQVRPELCFRESRGKEVIYDSRSGTGIQHEVGPASLALLRLLGDQQRPDRMAEKLGVPASEIASTLEDLVGRGLVFAEDGLYLSLVLPPSKSTAPAELLPSPAVAPPLPTRRAALGRMPGGRSSFSE